MFARCVRPKAAGGWAQSSIAIRASAHYPIHRACFSAAAIKYASRTSKKKPATPSRIPNTTFPSGNAFLSENALPPTTFLKSAKLSGAITLTPEESLNLLRRYITLAKSSKLNWEKDILKEFNVSTYTLRMLGQITARSPGNAQMSLGSHIIRTACKLGDVTALIDILKGPLEKGELRDPSLAEPLKQLESSARDGNAVAMVFFGRVLESRNLTDSALKWYIKAAQQGSEAKPGQLVSGVSDALVCQGVIYRKKGDVAHAKDVLAKAALEYDHPVAYFRLGQLQEKGSANQEVYLLKAAASGIVEASIDLGILYLQRATPESVKMAMEWFELAASTGNGDCMIHLASCLHAEGKYDEAISWLLKINTANDADKHRDKTRKLIYLYVGEEKGKKLIEDSWGHQI